MGDLIITVRGIGKLRDGHWVVWSETAGFTVYGATREDAEAAFRQAANALIESFGEDDDKLLEYLDRTGVEYRHKQPEEELFQAVVAR